MKKALKLLPLVAVVSAIAAISAAKENLGVKAASGQYAASPLPSTICLDDYEANDIRAYYSELNNKSEEDRKGQNLLASLKPILMKDQKYYSYDSGNAIWQIYEISDRDWERSPATAITQGTYDPATNTITNYKYGSMNDKKDNPYVHALYVDRSQENPKTAWTAHNPRSNSACIEREHIWPKSHGFDADEVPGARGDPIHLWAADGGANGLHSNYFYGNVDLTKTYKNARDDYSWDGNNYLGFSKTVPDSNQKVFEPQDCDKGDIARSVFYMVARYNNVAGDDTAIDSANPNLFLGDDVSKSEETGTSTATTPYSLGVLSDLLEWNKLDPVDEYEIHRNNLIHRNFTNNRNPFIDFPNWADIIWGGVTKAANPASDPLNGGNPNAISDFVINDVNHGTAVNPTATAITGTVSFGYSRNENGPFSSEKPTEAGTWYCEAKSVAEGDYSADVQVKSFRIIGKSNTIQFEFPETFKEGDSIAPTATALAGDVTFVYSDKEEGPFTSEVPSKPGTYWVKAISVNSGEYEGETVKRQFTISEATVIDTIKDKVDSLKDEDGKIFGLPPVVFYVIVAAVVVLVVFIVLVIFIKMSNKKKKKVGKKVAKELGVPVPKTTSTSSKSTAKKKSTSSSSKSTAKKSTSTKKK